MRSFALEIVTPDRVFYTGPAQSLTVDTPLGKMGVLYQHEPVVAALAPSEIKVIIEDKERRAVCTGGFLEVLGEKVYIFAQSIEWLEDIDAQRAQEALERAKRHLEAAQRENNKYEIQRHVWALERAQARLRSLKGRAEARLGEEKPDGGDTSGGSGGAEGEHR